MDNIFWHQQINDQPLYPDILWSQPEHKSMAGKLAIVGGNLHKFMTKDSTQSRPFAVFDIDGTLIRWQLYHAVADDMAKQNIINPQYC